MKKTRRNRQNGRDARGRWTNGTSGNPNGRPPNVPDLDMAEVYNFSQFPTEIVIGGQKQLMTRHEIVLFKMFESAMKGRITPLRILLEKFEQAELSKESIRWNLEKWVEIMAEDPSLVTKDAEYWMKMVVNSGGPRRSMIRTRRGGKRIRK